ncbi:TonB-dependent receptor plug domain-containing protein [Maribacter sp. 2307ULW6-5]|uniref:TonB-dependent receptor n=1 Tax=Maribacter sp. 2307ULW6-5 TaxID=3386275 RepID=UPI0039BC92EE
MTLLNPAKVLLLFFVLCLLDASAQTATITGMVLDEDRKPLPNVSIRAGKMGTASTDNGFYLLEIPADEKVTVLFSHLGHKDLELRDLVLTTNETYLFNPVLSTQAIQVASVTVTPTGQRRAEGVETLATETISTIPGANAGVENILKLLPGVSGNNELSTQYSVRGGNYDENLVYVNEIEVYRPFLVRSAQQEGLSFINSALLADVAFSAGGFQAKYGDRLSSVLDVTYKTPNQFALAGEVSFLGASLSLETRSKNKKVSSVTGLRYRNNALLVNSQETNGNFRPAFTDVQHYLTYRLSDKWHFNVLGNLSVNNYNNQPLDRQTNFGTIDDPRTLLVTYQGEENNRYATALGAVKATYALGHRTHLRFISSVYHTTEEEYSDIIARYRLGDLDTDPGSGNFGEPSATIGLGTQFNRSRNDLDALIVNLEHRGSHRTKKNVTEWGLKYTHEDIRDQLRESEFIDSAGFSVRPPRPEFMNNQPETPFTAPLLPFTGVNARNFVRTNRWSGFVQTGRQARWGKTDIHYNLGIRAHHWSVGGQGLERSSRTVVSPRGQFALKPEWKRDMLFRLSAGWYHQPPFYRELRNLNGEVVPNVKAQRSFHTVLAHEYSFLLWGRPFQLVGEAYFKDLDNVNPYTLEDVRIRYAANNDTKAYVYGAEARMHGAFVPGTESWISLGVLRTEENRNGRGFIPRPTDQRLKIGILFQDYVPNIPDLKMYLNLVYQTGLPGGSPNDADPYVFLNRLRDYRRADLGISYIFASRQKPGPDRGWLKRFKELSLGLEIFNMFNTQNAITNTWVRDVQSGNEFAVPNFLTSRVLNLKLRARL